jgi:hypothetical protein
MVKSIGVDPREAGGGEAVLPDGLRHHLDEDLVQAEDRDHGESRQVPAATRPQQAGQRGRDPPGEGDAEHDLQDRSDDRDDHRQRAMSESHGDAELADQAGERPCPGRRRGQQAGHQRPGPQRVQRQRRRVERAVQAGQEERQDQPAERECGVQGRRQVHRRAVVAQSREPGEGSDGHDERQHRADDEGDLRRGTRA